jgi:hypothetical protein
MTTQALSALLSPKPIACLCEKYYVFSAKKRGLKIATLIAKII